MTKVCFLIPSVASGGIETYLLRFLNFLNSTENITVLVRGNRNGELLAAYEKSGVKLVFMPLGYLGPTKALRFFRFLRINKFDVVCDFNANFAGLPLLVAKHAGVKERIAFYRQGSNHFKPGIVRNAVNTLMNYWVNRYATNILSNSEAALEFFFPDRKNEDTRFQVIYNGVNSEDYRIDESENEIRKSLNIPEGKFVVGHVGRLDPAKNHEVILKVFQKLNYKSSDFYFLFCGRDTEKLQLKINEFILLDNCKILGYRNDVPRILKAMDCFFFPSITEGQPNALIEAGLAGIPIVASNIKSIQEILPESFGEYLKNPYDEGGFVQLIKRIKSNQKNQNLTMLKDWFKTKFDAEKNFRVFQDIIS